MNDDEDSDDENPGSEVKTTEEDSDVDVSSLVQKIKVSKPVLRIYFILMLIRIRILVPP